MKHYLLLLCLLVPSVTCAVSGSWMADGPGVILSRAGSRDASQPLKAPGSLPDADARITTVSWVYRSLTPAPMNLQVRLCTPHRCIPLPTARGSSDELRGAPASATLRFVYALPASEKSICHGR